MKPWLEKWRNRYDPNDGAVVNDKDEYKLVPATPHGAWWDAELAAAAPDMCRALLAVEWSSSCHECGTPHRVCPRCDGADPSEGAVHPDEDGHHNDCSLDAALTKAGLTDQASRDAARKELGL